MTLSRYFNEHNAIIEETEKTCSAEIERLCVEVSHRVKSGHKVLFCGNGGSAADSQHLAAELSGRFERERKPLPGMALTVNTSVLTAIGNDYGYDDIFSRQVLAFGHPDDVLIGISTSGQSKNVIRAVDVAKELGIFTASLLGRDGGELKNRCHLSIVVPSNSTARVQEAHILIGHIICKYLEEDLFGGVDFLS